MTTTTHAEVFVTVDKNGKPRFSYFSKRALRLLPLTREVAEASFVAGATIYRKQAGTSIWAEGGVELVDAS